MKTQITPSAAPSSPCHSKLLIEQAPQIRESPGRYGLSAVTAEVKTGVPTVDLKEEITPKKLALEEGASDLEEIKAYFTVLEQDLAQQQQLLLEQQEEHQMHLVALERERVLERAEWEREWKEREEALLSALMSTAISKEKLMKDIRSHPFPLESTNHLAGTAVGKEGKLPRKWWCFKKHEPTPDVAPQDASSNGSASEHKKAAQFDLQELIELEERVRRAEADKQRKSRAKAEKKTKAAEKQCAKEGKKAERNQTRYWHHCILTMGCATT